jgi:hypothetical protein
MDVRTGGCLTTAGTEGPNFGSLWEPSSWRGLRLKHRNLTGSEADPKPSWDSVKFSFL